LVFVRVLDIEKGVHVLEGLIPYIISILFNHSFLLFASAWRKGLVGLDVYLSNLVTVLACFGQSVGRMELSYFLIPGLVDSL